MEVDNEQEAGQRRVDNLKEDCTDMGISINEAMKVVGDRNVWRSTVLNLG